MQDAIMGMGGEGADLLVSTSASFVCFGKSEAEAYLLPVAGPSETVFPPSQRRSLVLTLSVSLFL